MLGTRAMKSPGLSIPADSMASAVNTFTVIGTSLKVSLRRRAVTRTSSITSDEDGVASCAGAGADARAAATAAPMSPSFFVSFGRCM
jgi:hypothetical protein